MPKLLLAKADLDRALEMNPSDHNTLDSIGYYYYKIGDNEKAISYFDKAIETFPYCNDAIKHKAQILKEQGNNFEADKLFKEANRIEKEMPRF